MGRKVEGSRSGASRRFAVVVSRFNEAVTSRLRERAVGCLLEHGAGEEGVDEIWVPGAFEIPLAARACAETGRYDAVICLGAVIRGETPHFEFVARESARGIALVSQDTGVPAVFGVLTTDTVDQAMERSGGAFGDKGRDCALVALEMASVLDAVREG